MASVAHLRKVFPLSKITIKKKRYTHTVCLPHSLSVLTHTLQTQGRQPTILQDYIIT